MPNQSADQLRQIGTALLDAVGSPHERSAWVTETLVRANLAGHDSHGVMRIPQYVNQARQGHILPTADTVTVRETACTALFDARRGWGQVAAREAMEKAMALAAAHGIGLVALRNCPHVGRLGEYVLMAADADMIGTAYVNSQTDHSGTVVPWGGIDGRFTPTPLAFAAPSGLDWKVLVDITASVMPEGKLRDYHYRNALLPPDVIIDAEGMPTRNVNDFYGPPRGGILPLGAAAGHKGYALGVMIEMLAGGLTGAGYVSDDSESFGNGALFQVMNIAAFDEIDDFKRRTRELIAHVKSSRPRAGVSEVLFPGEPEYRKATLRARDGIELPDSLWDDITDLAVELDVDTGGP